MINKRSRNIVLCIVALVSFVVSSSIILCSNIGKEEIIDDEVRHIASAYYYTDLLLKFDFDVDTWEGKHLTTFGSWLYVHLGQLLMGVPLEWYAMRHGYKFYNMYDPHASIKENKRAGRIPPQDLLMFARRTVAFFGILCCVLVLAIGYYLRNIWVGVLAAVFLIKNKLFILCATRAMTDIHYSFFLLCALLVVIIFMRFSQKKSLFLLSFFCGTAAGLAASVKLTGIAVIGLFFLFFIIYQSILKKTGLRNALLCMIIFSVIAITVVYLFNPYLWDIRRPLKFPLLIKHWVVLNNSHARMASALWRNDRLGTLHRVLLLKYVDLPCGVVFLGVGILSSIAILVRSLRARIFDVRVVPFLFFAANYLFILVFMTVNWHRYYLPTIIARQFLVVIGIYETAIFLYRCFIDKKRIDHS